MQIQQFADQTVLAGELAREISKRLAAGIEENGTASLAVSGGSTPVQLFQYLSKTDIAWQYVHITLVDERWVATSEADSNEHLVRMHLLQNRAATAAFVGMKNSAATASAGEAEFSRQLKTISLPFDVLILGMGNDGHTASLFPGAAKLGEAVDMQSPKSCLGIAPLSAPHERLTLTLPTILDSRQIFLHITGENKLRVLQQAQGSGPAAAMPIRYIIRQEQTPLNIFWAP